MSTEICNASLEDTAVFKKVIFMSQAIEWQFARQLTRCEKLLESHNQLDDIQKFKLLLYIQDIDEKFSRIKSFRLFNAAEAEDFHERVQLLLIAKESILPPDLEVFPLASGEKQGDNSLKGTTHSVSDNSEKKREAAPVHADPSVSTALPSTIAPKSETVVFDEVLSKESGMKLRTKHQSFESSGHVVGSISKEVLDAEKRKHEEYTDVMIQYARQLKANTLAVKGILQDDHKVLSDTQSTVSSNASDLSTLRGKLNRFRKSSWRSTLQLWLLLFGACLVFVWMYMVIRTLPKAK